MNPGNNTKSFQAVLCEKEGCKSDSLKLIGEEPLSIHVDEKPYSVVMRTPGEEVSHAAGLFLGEGIIDSLNDFETIGYDDKLDANAVDIWLTPQRRKQIKNLLKRQTYISQTSCGICGKKMVEDLNQAILPLENGFELGIDKVFDCMHMLLKKQSIYPMTRGSHAALLFDDALEVLAFAEDVGRHNALDKAVGKAFMAGHIKRARLLVMSSRISYELVQKAARARIPVIISKSRPTALAVDMAQSLNMTLACAFEGTNLLILSSGHRILGQQG